MLGAVVTVHAYYQPAAARAIYHELVVVTPVFFIVHCSDEGHSMPTETLAFFKVFVVGLKLLMLANKEFPFTSLYANILQPICYVAGQTDSYSLYAMLLDRQTLLTLNKVEN